MVVVVVLCCVLVDSLSLPFPIKAVTLHGDRSSMTMTTEIHLQPPKLFYINFQMPDEEETF